MAGCYAADGSYNVTVVAGGTGGGGGGSTGSVTNPGTSGTQAQAVQGITGGVPQNISAASLPLPSGAATAANQGSLTSNGATKPPTAASGKIVETVFSLPAGASTTIIAANANRIAIEIQTDGTAEVGLSRTGAALTSAATSPLVVPTGSRPLYTMPIATLTAITAYTATAQTVRITEYLS